MRVPRVVTKNANTAASSGFLAGGQESAATRDRSTAGQDLDAPERGDP